MALSFTTKLKVLFKLLFNYLVIQVLIKTTSFKFLINYLESLKIKENKKNIKPSIVFLYERKIAKKLKVTQCLASAGCLFKTFKSLGYSATMFIGIENASGFTSHSWVSVNNENYLKDDEKSYKEIYTIN